MLYWIAYLAAGFIIGSALVAITKDYGKGCLIFCTLLWPLVLAALTAIQIAERTTNIRKRYVSWLLSLRNPSE